LAARDLPTGTVTFLFTDVEGSTRLLHELGDEHYAEALAEHRGLLRGAFAERGGVEVDTQGDAFFFAFARVPDALAAARAGQAALEGGPILVRMGLHTGSPLMTAEGYAGEDVHRAARIAAAAHGGQTVVSAATAALAAGDAGLVDLGQHRFKDLAAAERVFQLGPGDFPGLNSLGRTNLPVPATPFVGRASELAEVEELARGAARIVTLTGPGGTGKTRLALQAAAEISQDHPDGTYWVPLAAVREPALAASAVAQALEVVRGPEGSLDDALVGALDGKRALLLLDNAEHLLPAVADTVARLVSVAGPTVVITSRERLHLQGEHVFAVPGLTEPDAEELFVVRARQVDDTFSPTPAVAELCRRLDDLPLALEFAAARTSLFTAEQLLARLSDRLDLLRGARDADPRQQTLRATMEWSHELLSEDEQRLFARLSVFVSGCSLETAETVCDGDPETLQGLLDKSFLRRRAGTAGPRFWMLGTIRDYGVERLAASGEEDAARERHASWIASLAERIPLESIGAEYEVVRNAIAEEHAEVRAALAWARATGHVELSLRIGSALGLIWPSLFLEEAESWLEHAEQVVGEVPPELRGRVLRACATIALFVLADTERAVAFAERALELAIEAGDERLVRLIEYRLAMAAWQRGEPQRALSFLERALDDARTRGDRSREILALHHIGEIERDLGDFDRAEALMLESIALSRSVGDVQMADQTIHSLGDLNLDRGSLDEAAARYAESLRSAVERSEDRSVIYCIAGIASVVLERGADQEAATLWGAAEAAESRAGFRMLGAERARYAQRLDRLHGSPAWEEGRALGLAEAAQRALAAID
jgi:predicted ATPase